MLDDDEVDDVVVGISLDVFDDDVEELALLVDEMQLLVEADDEVDDIEVTVCLELDEIEL